MVTKRTDATELNSAAVPSFSTDKRRLIVVMGLPGSGTQAFAKALKARGWTYVNEDYDHSSRHSTLFFFFSFRLHGLEAMKSSRSG